jgi:nucleoid-associated protein YgaU
MNKLHYSALFAAITLLVMTACGDPIPVDQMVAAKQAIHRANSVKADKYAPAEIKAAQDKLTESHQYVIDEKMDEAKTSAEESKELADKAYDTAVPLLASDTIKIAERSLDEAGEAAADHLAQTEYQEASNKLKEANDLFQNKKYFEAYNAAIEADSRAKNARNIALGRKIELKYAIDGVKATLAEARRYGADEKEPEKYNLADSHIKEADDAYKTLKLKKGFSAVEAAKINADELESLSISETSKDRLAESSTVLEKAAASDGAKIAVDELDAAREANENAKALLAAGKYKESLAASDESMKMSNIVLSTSRPDDASVSSDGDGDGDDGDKTEQAVEAEKDYWEYKVRYVKDRRDCLWNVAVKYYKNGKLWKKIYDANRDIITDPNLIQPGWILKVPKPGK